MTKDVWITISSVQQTEELENEKIEIICPGNYYKKNGKSYVLYEEILEEDGLTTKNTLRFNEDMVSISKRGDVSVDMIFEKNRRNMTNYVTTYGTMLVGIEGHRIEIDEGDDSIDIHVEYSLDINYEHLYECSINMNIKSKKEEMNLTSK